MTSTEKHTEIIMVLDRSGSMEPIKRDMEGGIKTFVDEQKALPGKALFTLAQFDDRYEVVYDGVSLPDVGEIQLVPRGSTALLDALGKTLNVVGSRIDGLDDAKKPEKVIFIVITDGYENASKEFHRKDVLEIIKKRTESDKWEFVFLGADQDAIAEGAGYGFQTANSLTYKKTHEGTQCAFASVSRNAASYRIGGQSNMAFTKKDRDGQELYNVDQG